jgi:uncharacterized protein YkwD
MKGMPISHRAVLGALLGLVVLLVLPQVEADEEIAQRVLGAIQAGRKGTGAPPLERREDLDHAARQRAGAIARTPADRRMSMTDAIDVELRAHGVESFRRARTYVVLKRGFDDYAWAVLDGWRSDEVRWAETMSPTYDAIGLATETAADGWVVFVAILLEDALEIPLPDRIVLERDATIAVNEVRREHGLAELRSNETLVRIARGHSEDMARRQYFAHDTPEGVGSKDRAKRQGVKFRRLGENIHRNRGVADPVRAAVDSWMASRSHRKTILTPEYTETGIGVALDERGAVYFTQLFLLPLD